MASSKSSKTEKKTKKVGESTETANKPSKSRKDEDLGKQNKKKQNPKEKQKEKDPKKANKKDKDKEKEQKNKKNKLSNGHVKENKMLIVPSSSAEEEGESTYEEDNTEITNGRTTETKPNKGKRKKGDDDGKVAEDSKTQRFPMHRIKTIIRAEENDSRVSQEAVFVINKATEKFLEQLTQNAYTCCMQDRKKSLSYKHLSSVVNKQRRYDFLSDFVPEKIKAEDALAERNSGGTGELKNCKT
ncbi:hypothetical protein L6164_019117 [Bauhinia variegata]|uniref:Uncharacterized protein n=1 Tax=Bauhinia variegata TaxID=167791 RepID=A0ACB9NDB0_BAUVA|nr:hypothetical protein L6164_019117 [Bauhinia variegata]